MGICRYKVMLLVLALIGWGVLHFVSQSEAQANIDQQLTTLLAQNGFTGTIESKLEQRLGRKIDQKLAALGGLAFHDKLLALHNDNACAGCHAANLGVGDSQSIAIGVDNNNIVGPNRTGPRNQRRAPMVLNNAFYTALMWNGRFSANSGDPFNNSGGFTFPPPEGNSLSGFKHLLIAQAFIPPTERPEMAGFGAHVPGTNDGIRAAVVARLNANLEYRQEFAKIFPGVNNGGGITYDMLAKAIAEFEFTLTFADAPIDQYARGQKNALTSSQKQGALLFFGSAGCVQCHAVKGKSNEMFSDFKSHVAGVPQICPDVTNVAFDGPNGDEDFGLEQITGNSADRYKFRSSPLRNLKLQPTFFHNGAFTRLGDAIRFHINTIESARRYSPIEAGCDADLRLAPVEPVLARLDSRLVNKINLSQTQFLTLLDFVENGLQDKQATFDKLAKLIPKRVPSGMSVHIFEGTKQ
jgi:cytochrome c peroxidase